MEIITLADVKREEIVIALRQGKTLIYPTETCYGLGCDATNQEAVDTVYRIKKRDAGKPLLVLATDISMVQQYVDWNSKAEEVANQYWPGPLTLVLPAQSMTTLAQGVVSPEGDIAFRVSPHLWVADIIRHLGIPLVSTSANVQGQGNVYTLTDVLTMFEGQEFQPDYVIDAGVLPEVPSTTVVKISGDTLEVLRQGTIIL